MYLHVNILPMMIKEYIAHKYNCTSTWYQGL